MNIGLLLRSGSTFVDCRLSFVISDCTSLGCQALGTLTHSASLISVSSVSCHPTHPSHATRRVSPVARPQPGHRTQPSAPRLSTPTSPHHSMSTTGTPPGPPPGGPPGPPPGGPPGGPPGDPSGLPPGIIALMHRQEPELVRPLTLLIDVRTVVAPGLLSRLSTAELGSLIRRASNVMLRGDPILWIPDNPDLDIYLDETSLGWTLVVRPMR